MDYKFVIVSGALISVAAGLISYYDKRKDNISKSKSNRTNNLSFLILFLGVLISLFAGLNSLQKQLEAEDENKLNKIKSDSLSSALAQKQEELIRKQNQLNEKQNQLIGLEHNQNDTLRDLLSKSVVSIKIQHRLTEVQNDFYKNVVGDPTNYPLLTVVPNFFHFFPLDSLRKVNFKKECPNGCYEIRFLIANYGQYLIKEVKAQVLDFSEKNESDDFSNRDVVTNWTKDKLFPSETEEIYSLVIPVDSKEINFTVGIDWDGINQYTADLKYNFNSDSSELVPNITGGTALIRGRYQALKMLYADSIFLKQRRY